MNLHGQCNLLNSALSGFYKLCIQGSYKEPYKRGKKKKRGYLNAYLKGYYNRKNTQV